MRRGGCTGGSLARALHRGGLEQKQALPVVKRIPSRISLWKGRDFMSSFTSVLPGARVRTQDGFLGAVERLDQCGLGSNGQPDCMIVRSDDGQWRYRLPLMLVTDVTQQAFHPIVMLNFRPDQISHYIFERIDPSKVRETRVWEAGAEDSEPELRIPLAVEELVVHKLPVTLGRVHIHKGVETEEKHISVTIYHEEAVIEHIPADQYDASGANNPNETVVPVIEERLVVQKQSVVREYIRIRKNVVEEQQEVSDTLRREVVQVTEDGEDHIQGDQLDQRQQLLHEGRPQDHDALVPQGDDATPPRQP
jgi:uncharacterized protein (TIGR02271 family)